MASQKIELYQGDSITVLIPLIKPDGTPYDLTGAVVRWRVSWSSLDDDVDAVLKKDNQAAGGITVITGGISIAITKEESALLDVGPYYHELKVLKGTSVITTLSGLFLVKRCLAMVTA